MQDIKGYKGLYAIDASGQVWSYARKGNGRSKHNGIYLNPILGKNGYFMVNLYNNGVVRIHRIHRLVAEAFIKNPLNKREINHKNGIKTDNSVKNLEWCTRQENALHAHKTGLQLPQRGEKSGKSKLTQKQVDEIKAITGTSQSTIATIYGVTQSTISRLIKNKTWKI